MRQRYLKGTTPLFAIVFVGPQCKYFVVPKIREEFFARGCAALRAESGGVAASAVLLSEQIHYACPESVSFFCKAFSSLTARAFLLVATLALLDNLKDHECADPGSSK